METFAPPPGSPPNHEPAVTQKKSCTIPPGKLTATNLATVAAQSSALNSNPGGRPRYANTNCSPRNRSPSPIARSPGWEDGHTRHSSTQAHETENLGIPTASLESILCTEELHRRLSRPPIMNRRKRRL